MQVFAPGVTFGPLLTPAAPPPLQRSGGQILASSLSAAEPVLTLIPRTLKHGWPDFRCVGTTAAFRPQTDSRWSFFKEAVDTWLGKADLMTVLPRAAHMFVVRTDGKQRQTSPNNISACRGDGVRVEAAWTSNFQSPAFVSHQHQTLSGGDPIVVSVLRQADEEPGGSKRFPRVPADGVQRGEHAVLAGLRRPQARSQ